MNELNAFSERRNQSIKSHIVIDCFSNYLKMKTRACLNAHLWKESISVTIHRQKKAVPNLIKKN